MQNTAGYLHRVATYVNWPTASAVSCLSLANSGFVYTGTSDRVECPLCRLSIEDWNLIVTNPLTEHRLRSPMCSFFAAQSPCNPPLPRPPSSAGSLSAEQSPSDIDAVYCSALDRARRHGVVDDDARPIINISATSRDSAGARPAAIDRVNPDYGLLGNEAARLSTFHDWPVPHVPEPSTLARAGFFYTGQGDRTQCAFCRGMLHHWTPKDQPDSEHRRHFPDCAFVRQRDVGTVPLERQLSVGHQSAALEGEDIAHGTCVSVEAATATSSPAADVTVNTLPESEVRRHEIATAAISEQWTSAENYADQQSTRTTTTAADTLGMCFISVSFCYLRSRICNSPLAYRRAPPSVTLRIGV